ncbi:hypothetical protein XaC1_110 [Xanthomonas phage XaC1]|nr:hypothetical protein XaC1_110 [Xanthomonas phage XaC1]
MSRLDPELSKAIVIMGKMCNEYSDLDYFIRHAQDEAYFCSIKHKMVLSRYGSNIGFYETTNTTRRSFGYILLNADYQKRLRVFDNGSLIYAKSRYCWIDYKNDISFDKSDEYFEHLMNYDIKLLYTDFAFIDEVFDDIDCRVEIYL